MRRQRSIPLVASLALLLATGPAAADPKAAPPPRKPPVALPSGAPAELLGLDSRARAGDPAAQLELAERLAAGELDGTPDVARALVWYQQAAESGEADASWALADLYRNGLDMPVDLEKAVFWYGRAAAQGHAEAMYDLGLLHMEGGIVDPDPALAAQWFEQAADAGIARALFMLGTLYERGVDGAPDLDTARAWYVLAADAGDATGKAALDRLASGRPNVEIAAAPEETLAAAAPQPPRRTAVPATPKPGRAVPVDTAGVKEIQTRLAAAGFKVGRPDGRLGKRTAAAIRAYQKANALPVDGRATQALLTHLRGGGATSRS